ncbi:MAG: DUF1667 domain-containing protein [Chloroflexi bacterium]|nr:DUF1667 domain-containing protein [Chloroflexota bacterium]
MSQVREFICTTCPMGCRIRAICENGELRDAEGQACKRGLEYVRTELTDPRRMVATTVRVRGGRWPLVPVRTAAPVPKAGIPTILNLLREIEVQAPVTLGQVILADAAGTGIDVIASRDMPVR